MHMGTTGKIEIVMNGPVAGVHKDDVIAIDDINLAKCVKSIEVRESKVGDLLDVRLGFVVFPGLRISGASHVGVSDETYELLTSMGWQAPADENKDVEPTGRPVVVETTTVGDAGWVQQKSATPVAS